MENKSKKLTGNYRSLLQSLWYKRDYFCRKNKLAADGSFSYTDKRLAEEQQVSTKTIARAKKFLKESGYMIIRNGFKGRASKYWMLKRPQRGVTYKPLEVVDNLSKVVDNLSQITPQSVHLNKERTNINNKEDLIKTEPLKTVDKEGTRTLAKFLGVDKVRNLLLRGGVDEAEVTALLTSVN